MVQNSPVFVELVERWLEKLKENKTLWPAVESYLQKQQKSELLCWQQDADLAVQKLLHATWYYDFEAKFLELDGHPLEARVDVVAEKKPSAKKSLETLASLLLHDLRLWKEHLEKQEELSSDAGDLKEILTLIQGGGKNQQEFHLQHPPVVERFFFGRCPVNLDDNKSLKACSGCNSVCYSNREAQKSDWKKHKTICKALQHLVKSTPGHHPLHKKPENAKTVLNYLEHTLQRELNQYEQDLLTYPRLCNVCLSGNQECTFRKHVRILQSLLKNCEVCECVAYCSSKCSAEDAEEHEKSCSLLKIALMDYIYSRNNKACLSRKWRPRAKLMSGDLPTSIQVFFEEEMKLTSDSQAYQKASEMRQLSFEYTCQLTALFGAEKAGTLANKRSIHETDNLVIHVVGAREAETKDVTRWEIFHSHLPNLKALTVVFIGPELRSPYPLTDFCTASEHLRRTRGTNFLKSFPRYVFVNAAYHDFVDSNPRKKKSSSQNQELRKPDLVLALNCGFVFYKEWDASLPSMVTFANVPLIFTEYYQEDCKLDLQKLDSLVDDELDVVVKPSANPFCSMLPARIPTGFAFRNFKRRNVVMSNDFICVVRSQSA